MHKSIRHSFFTDCSFLKFVTERQVIIVFIYFPYLQSVWQSDGKRTAIQFLNSDMPSKYLNSISECDNLEHGTQFSFW